MIPFFCALRNKLEDILPPDVIGESERSHFRILNDPERMGIRVLEQRICTEFFKRNRLHPNRNDIGRLKGRVADRIGRLGLSADDLSITFTAVDRVGCEYADGDPDGGKFALMPDPDDPVVQRILEAHNVVVEEVGRTFKGFEYPDRYVYRPHLTVLQVYDGNSPARVRECEGAMRALVEDRPLVAEIDPLVFLPR